MITIDPLQLIVIPLALVLAGLFFAAWLYDLKTFRRRKKKDETIYRCTDCKRIYTLIQRTPLARCPRCGKQNPAVRQR
ncbi:MAG TPA: hypothetical protein VJ904_11895 [Tichowtungia sp.]|nr:hypothetical protein [Tichowtungia sp.]